jgi:hypothetical protein
MSRARSALARASAVGGSIAASARFASRSDSGSRAASRSDSSAMRNLGVSPTAAAFSRRIDRPNAWNVETVTASVTGPSRPSSRSRSSSAARRVNVIARHSSG